MSLLRRKLLREIWVGKGQFLAISALILIGVAFYGGVYTAFSNLRLSMRYPYETLNFADFTIRVGGAPPSLVDELRAVENVKAVQARLVLEVPMALPNMANEIVSARIISVPARSRAVVNDVLVTEGRYLTAGAQEVLAEKSFANRHGLEVGDVVVVTLGTQRAQLKVAGIVISPEYLWPAKSVLEHMPTVLRTWGVFFASEDTVQALLDGSPSINEFAVVVSDASVRDAVIARAKAVLDSYGVIDVVPRERQPSHWTLDLMVGGFDKLSLVFPLLFLSVASASTYAVLTGMVQAQRANIGILRALGYGRRQILLHYLSYAFLLAVIGSLAGTAAGYALSVYLSNIFASLVNLPLLRLEFRWDVAAVGLGLSLLFALISAFSPSWAAAKLSPAVALRPPAPASARALRLNHLLPLGFRLSSRVRIPLRNVFRNKRRTASTIIGIALSVGLVLATASFLDSMDDALVLRDSIKRYDLKVSFSQPQLAATISSVTAAEEVVRAEPILEVPYHLRFRDKEYAIVVMGLPTDSTLFHLFTNGERVNPTDTGILVSTALSEKAGVTVGDTVELHFRNDTERVTVQGLVDLPFEVGGVMSLDGLQRLAALPEVLTGVLVGVEEGKAETVKARLFMLNGVSSIVLTSQSRQDNVDMLRLFNGFTNSIIVFGGVMAFAVVFNTVTVNIFERRRELATMRTLGWGSRSLTAVITLENMLVGSIGIAFGIFLGQFLGDILLDLYESEFISFDAVIRPTTYLLAAAGIYVVMLASEVPGIRYITHLDLAKVTKEQAG